MRRQKSNWFLRRATGHYYTTTKNKRLHTDKLETKKFDPVVRKHVPLQRIEDQVAARRPSLTRPSSLK